jgi:hypothetical protein
MACSCEGRLAERRASLRGSVLLKRRRLRGLFRSSIRSDRNGSERRSKASLNNDSGVLAEDLEHRRWRQRGKRPADERWEPAARREHHAHRVARLRPRNDQGTPLRRGFLFTRLVRHRRAVVVRRMKTRRRRRQSRKNKAARRRPKYPWIVVFFRDLLVRFPLPPLVCSVLVDLAGRNRPGI